MKVKSISLFTVLALASGCAPYSESFDCPPGRGVGCKSLNTVNHMVEKGELPLEISPDQDARESDKKFISPLIEAKRGPLPLIRSLGPYKVPGPATHLKVWMAAYEDEEGIFHSPSFVYTALSSHSEKEKQ